jgi:DNA-binding MarR family transcriptional regulator
MNVSTDLLARELLEVVPLIMSTIRAELRRHQDGGLSLAEYRVLVYLRGRRDVSLSALAEHIGLGLPSMSKLVDGLVADGLISRTEAPGDRRRLALCLTDAGAVRVEGAVAATQAALSQTAADMDMEQRRKVFEALEALRSLFIRTEGGDGAEKVLIKQSMRETEL